MKTTNRLFAAALVLLAVLAPSGALAQNTVIQGGPTTAGHSPMYSSSGGAGSQPVVIDAGPAGGGQVGLGIGEGLYVARGTGTPPYVGQGTGPFGTNWCDYDAAKTNPTGYHFLCFSPNSSLGGALIAVGSGGTAAAAGFKINIDGSTYSFPFVLSGVVGPSVSVVNDMACWNNLTGTLLKDCGPPILGPGASTVNDLVLWNNTTATLVKDGTVGAGLLVTGSTLATTYTAPGSGGVPRTAPNWMGQYLSITDYGAVCDGVTDDSANIQKAITEAVALHLALHINGSVSGCLMSSVVTVTGALTLFGDGMDASLLLLASGAQDGIHVTGASGLIQNAVLFRDFQMRTAAATPTAGACITIDPSHAGSENDYSRITNVKLRNCYNGIVAGNTNFWWVDHNAFVNNFATDLTIAGANAGVDQVGLMVEANYFTRFMAPSNTHIGINYVSSGVTRIQNGNRFDGSFYQIFVNLAPGVATGELFIQGNSFENLEAIAGQASVAIRIGCQDSSSSLGQITINGNEISPLPAPSSTSYGIIASCPTNLQLYNVLITDNTLNTNSTAGAANTLVLLSGVKQAIIANNTCRAFSSGGTTTCFSVDATSSNIHFGAAKFAGAITTRYVNSVPAGSYTYSIGCQAGGVNVATATTAGAVFSGSATVTYAQAFDAAFPVIFTGGPTAGSGLPIALGPSSAPTATTTLALAIGGSNATHSFYYSACGKLD